MAAPTPTAPTPTAAPSSDLLADLQRDLKGSIQGEVRFDQWSRMLYSTDASIYRIVPLGVVLPRDEADVIATVQACAARKIPVLPRGDGSSLAGQTVGEAVILDLSRHMDAFVDLDPAGRRARVQPGLNLSRLNRSVADESLMYGPDPASADRATVGGVIGNNSTGAHSILYGMTVDHVERLRVVMADGTLAEFGSTSWSDALRASETSSRSLETRAWQAAVGIARDHRNEIEAAWPRTWRRVGGYNIDRLRSDEPLNLAGLVTGSEGTLCTVVEADLRLVECPTGTSVAVFSFDGLLSALATVPALLEQEPSAVELLDEMLMDLCRRSPEWGRRLTFVDGRPEAVLVVEVYGEHADDRRAHLQRLAEAARTSAEGPVGVRLVEEDDEKDNVWEVRKAGLGLLMSRRGDHKPIPFVEDTAVPPERLRDYISDVLGLLEEHRTDAAFYAHASAGCLHIRPLVDLKQSAEVEKMAALSTGMAELVLTHGGAMSGEHGDGLARSALNPRIYGGSVQRLFEQVKDAFDPHGIMNPGKIVRAGPMTDHLRFASGYDTEPGTHYVVRLLRRRWILPGGGDVQRFGCLPEARHRNHVPFVHGHEGGGTLHPRSGERAAGRVVGAGGCRWARRGAPAGHPRPLSWLQGLCGRVPEPGGHDEAQDRVPRSLSSGARSPDARPDVRRGGPAGPTGICHRAAE